MTDDKQLSDHQDPHNNIPESFKYAGAISRVMRTLASFRLASYASDVGEATRGALPNIFINAMYGITFGYIGLDLYLKYNDNKFKLLSQPKSETSNTLINPTPLQKYMGYHTLWHTQASLLFPTVTIHTIVSTTRKAINHMPNISPLGKRLMPAGIALMAIPFLIQPLDCLADKIMANTYCKYFDFAPEIRQH